VSRAFDIMLIALLIASAIAVIRLKDLLAAAIVFSTYSLMMCLLWLYRGAPDVAMTEAAVGAGITTVLFLVTISRTTRRER
jgi:uncharacterized MnhB-related membrane protein